MEIWSKFHKFEPKNHVNFWLVAIGGCASKMPQIASTSGMSQNDVQIIMEHISKNYLGDPRRFQKKKLFRYEPEPKNVTK